MIQWAKGAHHLSKRLKRKIYKLCGLTDLGREEQARRAAEILSSPEIKQKICNQNAGLSPKDIDNALKTIVDEEDIEDAYVESFDYMPVDKRQTTKIRLKYMLDKEESSRLTSVSETSILADKEQPFRPKNYPTYSLNEAIALINAQSIIDKDTKGK